MNYRPSKIEISAEVPFKNDLLERQGVAEALEGIVSTSVDGIVISLHGSWGLGKTTFLRMWEAKLNAAGHRVIYFNAWESDFFEEPLVALIGELHSLTVIRTDGAPSSLSARAYSGLKRLGGKILRRSLPVAVKIGTAGLLDASDIIEEAISQLGEEIARERIQSYEDSKNSMEEFKRTVTELALGGNEQTGTQWPLIFIIDELDRCKPTFAVRLLECVKHLFATGGIAFVLGLDRRQLAHAVRCQYGQEMDAEGYLRRFFDIELHLPSPNYEVFTKAQFGRFGLTEVFLERRSSGETQYDKANVEETLTLLFRVLGCSLRDIERAFTVLALAMRATPKNKMLFPYVLAILIVVKIKAPRLYEKLRSRTASIDEVLALIRPDDLSPDAPDAHTWMVLEALLRASLASRNEPGAYRNHYKVLAESLPTGKDRERANEVLSWIDSGQMRSAVGIMPYLLGKIDLFSEH